MSINTPWLILRYFNSLRIVTRRQLEVGNIHMFCKGQHSSNHLANTLDILGVAAIIHHNTNHPMRAIIQIHLPLHSIQLINPNASLGKQRSTLLLGIRASLSDLDKAIFFSSFFHRNWIEIQNENGGSMDERQKMEARDGIRYRIEWERAR